MSLINIFERDFNKEYNPNAAADRLKKAVQSPKAGVDSRLVMGFLAAGKMYPAIESKYAKFVEMVNFGCGTNFDKNFVFSKWKFADEVDVIGALDLNQMNPDNPQELIQLGISLGFSSHTIMSIKTLIK